MLVNFQMFSARRSGEGREEGGLRAHVGREGASTVGLHWQLQRVDLRRAGKREGGGKERPRDLEARMRRTGPWVK